MFSFLEKSCKIKWHRTQALSVTSSTQQHMGTKYKDKQSVDYNALILKDNQLLL